MRTNLLAFFLLIIPTLCYAGIKVEAVTYAQGEKIRDETTSYINKNHAKIINSNGRYRIINFDEKAMFEIDPERKIYIYDTFTTTTKNLNTESKAIDESLKKRLSKPGKSRDHSETPNIRIKKSDQIMAIAGFNTIKYQIYVNNKLYEDIWVTSDIHIGKISAYKKLLQWLQELNECISDDSPKLYLDSEFDRLIKDTIQIKNIYYGWKNAMVPQVNEVVRIRQIDIPESEFAIKIPKGYKKVEASQFYWAD